MLQYYSLEKRGANAMGKAELFTDGEAYERLMGR